jgi:hypothetical protein
MARSQHRPECVGGATRPSDSQVVKAQGTDWKRSLQLSASTPPTWEIQSVGGGERCGEACQRELLRQPHGGAFANENKILQRPPSLPGAQRRSKEPQERLGNVAIENDRREGGGMERQDLGQPPRRVRFGEGGASQCNDVSWPRRTTLRPRSNVTKTAEQRNCPLRPAPFSGTAGRSPAAIIAGWGSVPRCLSRNRTASQAPSEPYFVGGNQRPRRPSSPS